MKFKNCRDKILEDVANHLMVQIESLERLQLKLEDLIDYINSNNEIISIDSDIIEIVYPVYRKIVDIEGFIEVLGKNLKSTKNQWSL